MTVITTVIITNSLSKLNHTFFLLNRYDTKVELIWSVWNSVVRVCQVVCRDTYPRIVFFEEPVCGHLPVEEAAEYLDGSVVWCGHDCAL